MNNFNTSVDVEARLSEVILSVLISNSGKGELPISELKGTLTARGLNSVGRPGSAWRGLGNAGDFASLLEYLGFTLRRVYTKDGKFVRATYVTV